MKHPARSIESCVGPCPMTLLHLTMLSTSGRLVSPRDGECEHQSTPDSPNTPLPHALEHESVGSWELEVGC